MTDEFSARRIHSEQSAWTAIKREVKTASGAFMLFGCYWLCMALLAMWRMGWL